MLNSALPGTAVVSSSSAGSSDVDYTAVLRRLKRRPIDYFRLFYADTALFGAAAGTACGLSFFGVDHVLLASDTPFEPTPGL